GPENLQWYPKTTGGRKRAPDMLSVTKSCITMPGDSLLLRHGRYSIGALKRDGRVYLTLKPSTDGLGVFTKAEPIRLGTGALMKWLGRRGIQQGMYRIHEVRGGYVGVLIQAGIK